MPQNVTRQKALYIGTLLHLIENRKAQKFDRQNRSHAITNFVNTCKMKAKLFEIEAYTIAETARRLGYKSSRTIYRLLNRDVLEDYVYLHHS